MYIIDVIPLTRIPREQSQVYTYYCADTLQVGVLVLVPFRGREIFAIAVDCHNLQEKKLEIKKLSYDLKNITKIIYPKPVLTELGLDIAHWIVNYYWASLSLVLKTIFSLPVRKKLLDHKKELKEIGSPNKKINLEGEDQKIFEKIRKSKKSFIDFNIENKLSIFLKLIEEQIKRNCQIIILEPEINRVKKITTLLGQYFQPNRITAFHSEVTPTKWWENWQKILNQEVKIIVGTRAAIFAPIKNLGLIIIDQEENAAYKQSEQNPRYDARKVAQKLSQLTDAKLVFFSSTPSVESYYWTKNQENQKIGGYTDKTIFEEKLKEIRKPTPIIVDMREEIGRGNYSIFSETLIELIKSVLEDKKQVILFINRRGAATFIMCRDCGYVAKCHSCEVPLVYHFISPRPAQAQSNSESLLCHHCNWQTPSPIVCPKCGGVRIKYFGIGSQKVEKEIKKNFPFKYTARLDSDAAKNTLQEEKILKSFYEGKTDILIGTQMLLKILEESQLQVANTNKKNTPDGSTMLTINIGLVGIISIETLLNFPDFKAGEKTLRLATKLLSLAPKKLIQTYNPDNLVIKTLVSGNWLQFYERELKDRQILLYPPFVDLIKLYYAHRDYKKTESEATRLAKVLNDFLVRSSYSSFITIKGPAPAFIPKERGRYFWQIVIKIKNRESPNYEQISGTKQTEIRKLALSRVYPELVEEKGQKSEKINSEKNLEVRNKLLSLVPPDWIIDVDPESLL